LLSASEAGRLLGYGWGVSTLALTLFVLAWNGALRERAERRAGSLLGSPAGGSPSGDAQAEIARLQGILDDPHKYEEYQQQRAMGEFEAAQPQQIAMEAVPYKGPADAQVKVVEYSDFLCPFCQRIASAFREFLPQARGRVSVHFKHFPLDKSCNPTLKNDIHPGACLLARGALCANAQGRFWEYHDKVFSAPPQNPDRNRVLAIAAGAGLDGGRFSACLDAPETASRLQSEIAEAQRAGVDSTPSIFINGKRLPRVNDFLIAVERESERLGLPPLQAPKP
jgi:protein-disulfide isomerase